MLMIVLKIDFLKVTVCNYTNKVTTVILNKVISEP
ncbi:hypothetical protein QF024_002032 [Chryseobacterium nepalense]|nr:hypothetical protein [Chryseobacterium nepalense]